MKYVAAICCFLLMGCSQDHAQVSSAPASHNESIARGSTSPAAPVQLTYQVPTDIAANQPTTIEVSINTRLNQGSLLVEIARQEGATLLGDTRYRFDLAAISTRPIPLHLKVLPADQAERFLAVLVTVDTEMGAMVRSFRIDLSTPSAVQESEKHAPRGALIQQ